MNDVEILLEHSPQRNDNEMRSYSEKNWNIALWNGRKSFVSHPFYQQHLWRKLCGRYIKWDECPFHWRALLIILSVAFYFILIPLIVLYDTVSCSNDILFENSSDLNRRTKKERKYKAFCRGIIHTPIFRITIHHFLESLFIVAVFLSTVDPLEEFNKKQLKWFDVLTVSFVALYLLGDLVELYHAGRRLLRSFWIFYNFVTSLFLMIGIITLGISYSLLETDDRAKLSGNAPANIGATIFAFTAPLVMLRPLRWFLFSKTLGTTIVCTIKVMVNVIQVFLIYIIIFAANAAGLFCLFKPFFNRRTISDVMIRSNPSEYQMVKPDLATKYGWIGAMFWRLYDPGEPDFASIRRCKGGNCTGDPDYDDISLEFSHLMGVVMWAMFQGVITIVLLNLLIALMNSTYTRVWAKADEIWKYSKSFYQVKFLDSRTSMPPPFK